MVHTLLCRPFPERGQKEKLVYRLYPRINTLVMEGGRTERGQSRVCGAVTTTVKDLCRPEGQMIRPSCPPWGGVPGLSAPLDLSLEASCIGLGMTLGKKTISSWRWVRTEEVDSQQLGQEVPYFWSGSGNCTADSSKNARKKGTACWETCT